jgi:tripartite motif-containing protein 71
MANPAHAQRYVLQGTIGTPGTAAGQYLNPLDITGDSQGNLYTTDCANHRVYKYGPDGSLVKHWGTPGTGPDQLSEPHGIAVDGLGRVYVAEYGVGRVHVYDTDGNSLFTFGQSGSGDGFFVHPRSIAFHPDGFIFVGDEGSNKIQKFTRDGVFVASFGGPGSGAGQFQRLMGIAVDSAGNILAVDRDAGKIQRFTAGGQYLTSFGVTGTGNGDLNGPGYVKTDKNGFIYVTEYLGAPGSGTSRIQKFNHLGEFITSFSPSNLPSTAFVPMNPYIDKNGNVFVADAGTQILYKFVPQYPAYRKVSTLRSPVFAYNGGGDGQLKMFPDGSYLVANNAVSGYVTKMKPDGQAVWNVGIGSYVRGVAFDQQGNVFANRAGSGTILKYNRDGDYLGQWSSGGTWNFRLMVDRYNVLWSTTHEGVINKWSTSGSYLGYFGSGKRGSGQYDFSGPTGLGFDHLDNVYVADQDNLRLQKFTTNGALLWLKSLPYAPVALVVDKQSNLYAVDLFKKLEVLDADGNVRTSILNFSGVTSSICLDSQERIHAYCSDSNDRRIEVWEPFYADSNAPYTNISFSPSTSASGWQNSPVSVTLSATDNAGGSGIKEIHYSIDMGPELVVAGATASFNISGDGTHTVAYWAVDNADNIEPTKYATVKIDTVKPGVVLTPSPAPNAAGWHKAAVSVGVAGTDSGSGVAQIRATLNMGAEQTTSGTSATVAVAGQGIHTVLAWAIDTAGNMGDPVSTTIRIDTTAPVATATVLDRVLEVQGSDDLSGVAERRYAIDNGPEAVYSGPVVLPVNARFVRVRAIDVAGNSSPTTVVPVGAFLKSIEASPSPAYAGATITVTVELLAAAPTGGFTLDLTSSKPAILPVPPTLTIPAGALKGTFTATAAAVATDTTVQLRAGAGDAVVATGVAILVPTPKLLRLVPSLVSAGASSTGTVTLVAPAPAGGQAIALQSLNPAVATVPASVLVPAGKTTATFTVVSNPESGDGAVLITAAADDAVAAAALTVRAVAPKTVTLSSVAMTGGTSVVGTVTLARAAPASGTVVRLVSSEPCLAVPPTVTVAAGKTTATFAVTTQPVEIDQTVSVQARAGGVVVRTSARVLAPRLSSLSFLPSKVTGGQGSIGAVTLTGPAPSGGAVVRLRSVDGVVQVPSTVLVEAGQLSATFPVSTLVPPSTVNVVVGAFRNSDSKTAVLTVNR